MDYTNLTEKELSQIRDSVESELRQRRITGLISPTTHLYRADADVIVKPKSVTAYFVSCQATKYDLHREADLALQSQIEESAEFQPVPDRSSIKYSRVRRLAGIPTRCKASVPWGAYEMGLGGVSLKKIHTLLRRQSK